MKKQYTIRGIQKILEKVSKEDLAKYYGVDVKADFESLIAKSFQAKGIPNHSEIGLYVNLTAEECRKRTQEGMSVKPQDIAAEFYHQDERKRAMYGMDYNIFDVMDEKSPVFSVVYFLVDEPIKETELADSAVRYHVGGYHYNGLIMGKHFYEEHKEEFSKYEKSRGNIQAVDNYISNFVNEFEDVAYTKGAGTKKDTKKQMQ